MRIIGGLYKGKKLLFPEAEGLRPTPDRIRETLFNWLMNDIRGARCLDAFAGSGALGLEAFSRGASSVTFLEQSSMVYAHLNKIISEFNQPNLKLLQVDACTFLQSNIQEFDIVFLDPPFTKNYLPQCLQYLFENKGFIKNGFVYLESSQALQVNPNQWQQLKLKQAGQVVYGLFRKL